MFAASKAREDTVKGILLLAEKFINNDVEPKVLTAIKLGYYKIEMSLEELENEKAIGPAVAEVLNSLGYDAKYHYREGAKHEPLLSVSWENSN
jgi:hypothetical protein